MYLPRWFKMAASHRGRSALSFLYVEVFNGSAVSWIIFNLRRSPENNGSEEKCRSVTKFFERRFHVCSLARSRGHLKCKIKRAARRIAGNVFVLVIVETTSEKWAYFSFPCSINGRHYENRPFDLLLWNYNSGMIKWNTVFSQSFFVI